MNDTPRPSAAEGFGNSAQRTIKVILSALAVVLTVATVLMFFADRSNANKSVLELALSTGRSFFQSQVAMRGWISDLGGVYVIPTEDVSNSNRFSHRRLSVHQDRSSLHGRG